MYRLAIIAWLCYAKLSMSTKSVNNLVIVESPAKAHTIGGYLGKGFNVMASVGHIRSITKKAPKGQKPIDTDNNFETIYEIDPEKKKTVQELKSAVKKADTVWLATDEDREGEAIAWHLCQVLGLDPAKTNRIVFHEITKGAIDNAVKNPRHVDMDLVHAQQARQILDRLVGFELSPVVWRKVPGGKSAGRVQSPAVRLLVEREREINDFKSKFTFKTTGEFTKSRSKIKAVLDKEFNTETEAKQFLDSLDSATYAVSKVTKSEGMRKPLPPFTTSTLQQDANARLGYSARTTMSIAQGLYQSGFITYMRTDSVNLSKQALAQAADYIKSTYGDQYHQFRTYKTKTAGAQEAHEAIRPTDLKREHVPGSDTRAQKLYDLIRNRTLATQMADAKIERTTATIDISNHNDKFTAKGEVVVFDGFLKVYGTSKDEVLPILASGDKLNLHEIVARQTFARPPARYTEGSLVKKLEDLEIGRPSTYATIISTIQTRGYAKKGDSEGVERKVIELIRDKTGVSERTVTEKTGSTKGKLVPTDAGIVVADFLRDYFCDIVDYKFTAKVENELDEIAENKLDKVKMLRAFYDPFHAEIAKSDSIDRSAVAGQRLVGVDPKDQIPIYARYGRYGPMLQKGDSNIPDQKITFANMPAGASVDTVTLEQALKMFSLPRTVGHTDDDQEIIASIGRFGPYIKIGSNFVSIKPLSPFEIDEAKARQLWLEKQAADAAKHIATWGNVQILNGRYGPYITDGVKNVKIPKDTDPKSITEAQAKEILEKAPEKPARGRRTATRKTAAKKSTTKTGTKKTTTRKTTTKKAASKKTTTRRRTTKKTAA